MWGDAGQGRRLDTYIKLRRNFIEGGGLRDYPAPGQGEVLAREYGALYRDAQDFLDRCGGDLRGPLTDLAKRGLILGTTAATHAVLPLLATTGARRAQVRTAARNHRSRFGASPSGFWLPECGYQEGLDEILREEGVLWTVAAEESVLNADPRPENGLRRPIRTRSGLSLFGRDPQAARWVWDRHSGYPADPVHREFHRDLGYDLPAGSLGPLAPKDGKPRALGLKGHRISGSAVPLGQKESYDPLPARERARAQANGFIRSCAGSLRAFQGDGKPLVVGAFDAELFGHWWYEGPTFLESVLRAASVGDEGLVLSDPASYLGAFPLGPEGRPAPATWGAGGDFRSWVDESTAESLGELREAERRMGRAAGRSRSSGGLVERALNAAAWRLQLAEASDWAFMTSQGSFPGFAQARLRKHLEGFSEILNVLDHEQANLARVRAWEMEEPPLPGIDFRDYIPRPGDEG